MSNGRSVDSIQEGSLDNSIFAMFKHGTIRQQSNNKNQKNNEDAELRKNTITMATSEEANKNQNNVTDFTFKNITTCPDCGSSVMHEGGCVTCPGCGFSKCE